MAVQWKDVTGTILAAGRGSRMYELGMEFPKSLLPICNESLLNTHVQRMVALGIRRIIVVIGHLGSMVVSELSANIPRGVEITFVEQDSPLGIAHAVGRLEHLIDGPLLLFLADIYFHAPGLPAMIDSLPPDGNGAVLAVRNEPRIDAIRKNFTVQLAADGRVRRVIEKPRVVNTSLKGCGMYLFGPCVFDAVRKTPRTAARDEYEITDTIQIMVDDDVPVRIAEVVTQDINLTFPVDLLECNLWQLSHSGLTTLVANSATVDPAATIKNSVVGPNARIDGSAKISDSLILGGATVTGDVKLQRCIVTPKQVIQC